MKNLLNLSQKQATEICEIRKQFDNTPTELLVTDLGKIMATYHHTKKRGVVKKISKEVNVTPGRLYHFTKACGQHVRPAFETYCGLIALGSNPDLETPVEVESAIGLSQEEAKKITKLYNRFCKLPTTDLNMELLTIMKTYRTRVFGQINLLTEKTGLSRHHLYKLSKPANVHIPSSFDTYVRIIALGPNNGEHIPHA